jgi:amidophosphoribosyltransferase
MQDHDRPEHHCGVVGYALSCDAVPYLKKGLRIIQHRGQEATGIAVANGKAIKYLRGMGLVHEVLSGHNFNAMSGNHGIGHVRYSTTGSSCAENCQPIQVSTMAGDVALAHNGDIVNADKLRQKLQSEGWAFLTTTDSEIIIRMMATELAQGPDPIRAIKNVMKVIEGAYSLTILVGDRVFGVRDPLGFRPLSIGRFSEGYALASESAVFDVSGGEFVRDVAPGEIVELNHTGFISTRTTVPTHKAHCMFEWVYFARPDSVLDGKEVYQVRKNLGNILAREQPVEADVVVAVPDSGRAHALGFSEVSGIPYEEGFMKNRYIERTFIMPEQTQRDEGVLGTTMRKIVQMTRRAGAKEVHVRIGCPPIIAPCYYGIDMKTREQFAAINRTHEDIARLITADSVGYNSLKGLVKALEIEENDLCLACLNGEYPTQIAGEKMRFQRRLDV